MLLSGHLSRPQLSMLCFDSCAVARPGTAKVRRGISLCNSLNTSPTQRRNGSKWQSYAQQLPASRCHGTAMQHLSFVYFYALRLHLKPEKSSFMARELRHWPQRCANLGREPEPHARTLAIGAGNCRLRPNEGRPWTCKALCS